MAEEARYTYRNGSRPEGVVVYDGSSKIQSWHDSDPAHGQHNAFDLVRLHLFGGLDDESTLALPITERPSFREMARLASEDPLVRQQMAVSEFDDLGDPPQDPPAPARKRLAVPLSVLRANPTQTRWLVRDELERGVTALLVGPRGSYKSFKALHWAMTCAVQGHPVYVVSAEGNDFERRTSAWMQHNDIRVDPPIYVVERRLDLNSHKGVEEIRQDCLDWGIRPVLFVLDTFSKLSGGLDENDNSQVKQFIGRLDNGLKRPDAFDATVLLVAHTGHSDAGRARGASALEADTDAAYVVSAAGGTVRVSRERFKSSGVMPPLVYTPKEITLPREDEDGRPVTSMVLEPLSGEERRGLKLPTRKWQKHVWGVLTEMAPDGSTVDVNVLLTEATQRLPQDTGSPRDLRRQNCRVALDGLVINGLAFMHGSQLSITPVAIGEDWLA